MKRYIVDTSAAVEIVTGSAELSVGPQIQLFAPELIDIEFASVLRKLVRRRRIDAVLAENHIVAWAENRLTRCPHAPLLRRVWELRDNFTNYDASYVALAERLQFPLITTDRKLAGAAQKYCNVLTLDAR